MKKHTSIKYVAIILLCLLLSEAHIALCCDDDKAKYEKTEHFSADFAPGQTVYLQNNIGEIKVTGADVKDCSVTATITAKAATEEEAEKLAEKVRIKLLPSDNKLDIKVEQPDKTFNCSITIDFDITMPKQAALQLGANIGEINISGIAKKIKAETNVGNISCREIAGDIDIHTNVGKANVSYSRTAPGACNANIKTDVGKIDFTAPPDLSAQVNFSTDIGTIETNLPLDIKGMLGKKSSGTIGKGEGRVTLKTNVGSIKIK
jgi:hypothetical protein